MPTLTDDDQKSAIDQKVEDGHGAYANAGIDQLEALANDPSQHSDDSVKEAEQAPDNSINYTGKGKQNLNQPKLQKALTFAKKRGGIIGLISLFGIGGGILAGFFGPASMLINMTENFSLSNDSSSTALERRFMKIFGNMTNPDNDAICVNSSKNIKCKMGKISNKALRQLEKKGVVAYEGNDKIDTKKRGYPSKNPTSYKIDLNDGYGQRTITAKQLPGFLANNPKAASKILGVKGAFNLRVKAWTGKHISQKFYKKFGLNKAGGIADGVKSKYSNATEKLRSGLDKLISTIPGMDKLKNLDSALRTKMGDKFTKFKGGGIAYSIAAGTCIVSKAPAVISAGVAAAELARLMPIASNLVLSPGSKAKASGVDTDNSITSEDMDLIGTLLTNKTKDSDGNMSSALDSKYLLAAMGVNKNKPGVSTAFSPGYSVLTNEFMQAARQAGKEAEPVCNVILNPITMFTFMIAESAITKSNPVGAIAGFVGGWLVGEATSNIVNAIMQDLASKVINELADTDKYNNIQGRDLGDAVGMSTAAFFSAGGMARNLPTLKTSQLTAFDNMQKENEAFQRDMDIASLSPFDISSRYTFLGSIVYNTRMGMISNGSYSVSSTLSSLASLSSRLTMNTGAATNFTNQYCNYADEFGLDTENANDTPAINMAGLPCTGITPEQAAMSTSDAIEILSQKGWINQGVDINDNATIEDLVKSKFIKTDNPLYEYVSGSCSDASTGDYLFEVSGCTVPSSVTSGNVNVGSTDTSTYCKEEVDEEIVDNCSDISSPETDGGDSTKAFQAMAVFLLDFQAAQSINGEDEEVFTNNGSSNVSENSGKVNAEGWAYPMDSPKELNTYGGHNGDDMPAPEGSKVYSIREGIVKETQTMPPEQIATYCPTNLPGVRINGAQNNLIIESVVNGTTYVHRYAHLSKFNVNAGDTVKAGDLVGYSGDTGCSSGAHLHLDINSGAIFPREIFGTSF